MDLLNKLWGGYSRRSVTAHSAGLMQVNCVVQTNLYCQRCLRSDRNLLRIFAYDLELEVPNR